MIYLHIDIDNVWCYENEFGVPIYPDKQYIYTQSLPCLLKLLKKTGSKVTFFLIGKDLDLPSCRAFCKKAIFLGHEIANHTWSHPINFASMTYAKKSLEIGKSHREIIKLCKTTPVGFRGPGYYQDKEIVSLLFANKYLYDSSILPGYAPLLMSTYAKIKGGGSKNKIFGRSNYLFQKDTPHILSGILTKQTVQELPISVMPWLRMPIHPTFAYFFGAGYRNLILQHLSHKQPYLLYVCHAIDFADLHQPKSPVIPLRFTFSERMNYFENILENLFKANGGPLETIRDVLTKGKPITTNLHSHR